MKINLVINSSPNYADVQENIFAPIRALLEPAEYTQGRYRNGALNFSLFIRDRADVVMSHGAADKNYFWIRDGNGLRFANALKAVLVPGNWLRRRILKSNRLALLDEQVVAVGWPRLDVLRRLAASRCRDRSAGTVLWAPTHDKVKRGSEARSTSSYPDFKRYLPMIEQDFSVETSLHPRNRTDKKPTLEKLLDADCVVSDFGTLVYEAWALGKPVLFPRWILGERIQQYLPGSAEAYIFRKKVGYHPESPEEMMDILRSGPAITPDVAEFMSAYLENYRQGSASEQVVKALRRLAGTGE